MGGVHVTSSGQALPDPVSLSPKSSLSTAAAHLNSPGVPEPTSARRQTHYGRVAAPISALLTVNLP